MGQIRHFVLGVHTLFYGYIFFFEKKVAKIFAGFKKKSYLCIRVKKESNKQT